MKFAKEIDEDLVPEWRAKYFSYKLGKKKVKAVSRALRAVNRTPQTPGRPNLTTALSGDELTFTHYDFARRHERSQPKNTPQSQNGSAKGRTAPGGHKTQAGRPKDGLDRRSSLTMFSTSPPVIAQHPESNIEEVQEAAQEVDPGEESDDTDGSSDSERAGNDEERPLQQQTSANVAAPQHRTRYGSIMGTPPERTLDKTSEREQLPPLNLPDPALDSSKNKPPNFRAQSDRGRPLLHDDDRSDSNPPRIQRAPTDGPQSRKLSSLPNLPKRLFKKDGTRNEGSSGPGSKLRRAFASRRLDSPAIDMTQVESYRDLDAKQEDFFNFLDKELNKVENFYKQKEEEATSRLHVLREQLHEMRDRRLEDLERAKKGGKIADDGVLDGQIPIMTNPFEVRGKADQLKQGILEPVVRLFEPHSKIGKTSKAREELGSPRVSGIQKEEMNSNHKSDFTRKQQHHEKVPYRYAKRKLKLALQEFYRGLELLKSYALLNRTAFRKINKKYDKAVMARPPLRYMSEKVNHAYFVKSTMIEETLMAVEDLYARYFERGNRKVAVNKLRSHLRHGEYSGVAFRNGLYVAAGLGLAMSGMVNGAPYLFSENPDTKTQASYLFQLYGGYFMAVLLFLFFVIDCGIWTKARINYIFVFEYDTRYTLDWRQISELPCFFLFLNGLFLWINFQFHDEHVTYLWWPVILIGLTAIIIFLPIKILYWRARQWFIYSNWRLLLAGVYPVEFRDFFMGDMYCSETYTLSQMEVFFCVYGHKWNDPAQCNSNHSRVLGFLTTLPAIWRALQCLRRYYDSRNWFPHLANFAKYCCNILYYMSLSMYRIHLNGHMKAMFIVFALVNGLYCSFWDVFMDFSLGNPWSKNFLLRDNLAFRRKRIYYVVMILDVVLRQQWILYAIFTEDLQHSAAMSFFIALLEVIRRGIWSLFRVENEHCNNVEKFRASRDIPLPYDVSESRTGSLDDTRRQTNESDSPENTKSDTPKTSQKPDSDAATSQDVERANTSNSSAESQKSVNPGIRALKRVGTVIAAAHSQDFEKKRRPEIVGRSPQEEAMMGNETSDDDDTDIDDDRRESRMSQESEDISTVRRRKKRAANMDVSDDDNKKNNDADGDISPGHGSASGSRSGSASGSGSRTRVARTTGRQERDPDTLQPVVDEDEIEIQQAKEHLAQARAAKEDPSD